MNLKSKIAAAVASATMFALPAMAFASVSVNNILFDNGAGNITASSGSQVNVQLYVNTSGTNDVESVFVKFPNAGGAAQQGTCYDVADQIGESPVNGWVFNFPITVPVNAGIWDITVATHGTNGDAADNTCTTAADTTQTFNGRVTVTADNSSGTPTGNSGGSNSNTGSTGSLAALQALVAQLAAQVQAILHPTTPTPTTSGVCTQYAQANSGTQPNVYSDANVRLQGFLLSQGASIPALKAGASFGFYGNQTTAAVGWFNSTNHCS